MPSITSVWSPLPKFSASMLLTRFQSGLPSSSGNRCSPQHSSQWLMKTIFPWHTHGVERVAAKELTKPDHQEGKNGRITIVFQNGINVLYKDDSRSPCLDLRPPEFCRQLTFENVATTCLSGGKYLFQRSAEQSWRTQQESTARSEWKPSDGM